LLLRLPLGFYVFRLAYVIRCAHAAQHVVGEEELAVGRDHHDLQFVGEALGDDLVDQQRILLQDRGLAGHALGVGGGGQADAFGFGLGQKFAAFALGFAVDEFGFAGSLGILDGGFLARFGFEFRLLNLFLFQREHVLHGIGLALGLQHADGGLSFGLFHLLNLIGVGVSFGDLHLLLVNFGLDTHAVVLLFLQQQRLEAFGVLLRKFDVTQHDFFHYDAVGGQPFANDFGGALTNFFALGGENFAHRVTRHQFAPRRGHHGRHDLLFQRLRQIGFNVVEALGVNLITDGDGQAECESFFGLDMEG